MDELQISGKRFVSSRRIAKENNYHTDYIGQLIRGGKVKGQKVGRTWYVDEASFKEYIGDEKVSTFGVETVEPITAAEAPQAVEPAVFAAVDPIIIKEEEPLVSEIKLEVIEVLENNNLEKETLQEKKGFSPRISAGLTYFADEEPLLPEIAPKKEVSRIVPLSAGLIGEKKGGESVAVLQHHPRMMRAVFGILAGGVAIFVFSAAVSSALFQNINIDGGNSASISYSIGW